MSKQQQDKDKKKEDGNLGKVDLNEKKSKERYGRSGLINENATCYSNSAIQALAHVPEVVQLALTEYKPEQAVSGNLGVVNSFFSLLREMWMETKEKHSASNVNKAMTCKFNNFDKNRQCDSSEFLVFDFGVN